MDFSIAESLVRRRLSQGRAIERIWREVRAIRILEGTSEIMRHIVARDMLRNETGSNNPIFTREGGTS